MYNQIPYTNYPMINSLGNPQSGISSLLGLSKKSFNWDTFLNNAQRTLNVINQAMPIYNQVRPMFRNMGTIFKVIGELNSAPALNAVSSAASNVASTAIASTPKFFV